MMTQIQHSLLHDSLANVLADIDHLVLSWFGGDMVDWFGFFSISEPLTLHGGPRTYLSDAL